MDEIIVIVLCLILNGLFAAYEMAFVSVPRAELRKLAREGSKKAKSLLELRKSPERTLSAIQIGITLVGAIAAAVGGVGAGETLEPYFINSFQFSERSAEILSVVLVVVPLTYLSVVIGELVPKSLALRNPTKIVMAGTNALLIADRFLSPVISALEWSTKTILSSLFRRQKTPHESTSESIEIDSFSPVHQKFMLNMAEIERKRIKDILLPWDQIVFVQKSSTIESVTQVVISSGHTRLPVFESDQVVGLLHTKEFIAFKESGETSWNDLIRPVLHVLPTDSALGVLRLLQANRSHMAIVRSPEGNLLGLVTLEDIIEEVVGEIFDEDDDQRIRKIYAAKLRSRNLPRP